MSFFVNLVLGRSEDAAVSIDAVTAYPEGFVCRVNVCHRLDEARFESPFHSRHLFARRRCRRDPGVGRRRGRRCGALRKDRLAHDERTLPGAACGRSVG